MLGTPQNGITVHSIIVVCLKQVSDNGLIKIHFLNGIRILVTQAYVSHYTDYPIMAEKSYKNIKFSYS